MHHAEHVWINQGEATTCRLTVSEELQDGEVHVALPVGILLDGDAVPCGGKDVAAADGHQLAALVPARHVVQHSRIVDESVQFADEEETEGIRLTNSLCAF